MLVTSKSISPSHSAIFSQTKSILGVGAAVKSILFDATYSRADAKSVNDKDFNLNWLQGVFTFYNAVQNLLYQS